MKRLTGSCFLAFMLLGPLLWAQEATPGDERKNYIIADVIVEGAEYSDNNAIISLSGLAVGESITIPSYQTSDVMKRLWNENIFSDIQLLHEINGNTVKFTIRVVERPRIAQIEFDGINKTQAEDLKEKINFIRGTILTDSKSQTAQRIIRNFYVEKGFYHVGIEINEQPDQVIRNGVMVNINIDKGKRTKIQEIELVGNDAFNDRKVKRLLKKVKEKRFWRFWARSKYVPKTFSEAKDNLITTYNDEGYRDALIETDSVWSVDNKHVKVKISLFEGDRYFFRNIAWTGNYKYNSEILSAKLGIERGDIFSKSKLDKRLNGDPNGGDVSSLYLDDGYLFFNVNPVEVAVVEDSIDLELRISEGPQATIDEIILEGNDKTSDYVILREIRTAPGQKFSRSAIIRSQREILALGYFDQEKLGVEPQPNINSGTVDIKYSVTERSSDQLQLQGGWGGSYRDQFGNTFGGGFIGTVQLVFNNFSTKRMFDPKAWRPVPSGDGQKLNLAVQMNGLGDKNFSISFLEPWLGGKKPNSLGVSLSYLIFQRGFTFSDLYRNAILNTSVDFRKRLRFPDDFFFSNTSLRYKYFDIENPFQVFNVFRPENNGGITESQAFIHILTLKQSFDRNSVDAPIYPRSGSIMSFGVEVTPPYSLFRKDANYEEMLNSEKFNLLEYHKWTFNSNWFFNIIGDMVLSTKIEAGFLGKYNSEVGISPFERYFLGGSGLAGQGFGGLDGREIVALRGYQDFSIINNGDGYPIYTRFITELRYPITLNQSAPVWVLAFLEGGNGYTSMRKYNPFDLKRAAGVGLRVMLPMVGLLGLDWGYGFDNDNRGDRSQFHFIIGQQF